MNEPTLSRREIHLSAPLLTTLGAGLLTLLIYLIGTHGPFLHDDTAQITLNPDIQIGALSLENLRHADDKYPSRPLPMISFALNHLQCGLAPSCYKTTNVLLHLATGATLYFLLWTIGQAARRRQLFTMPAWLPAAVTSLWLLHPLNVSTTLYVVQRMAIMSTLFSALALAAWLQARFIAGESRGRVAWLLVAAASSLAAWWSKENAVLVVPLALLLELLLLDPVHRSNLAARLGGPAMAAGMATMVMVAALTMLSLHPPRVIADSYLQRDFLPTERLLSESRILWYYVGEILWPDQERMNFFIDFLPVSHSLVDPPVTLAAVAAWAVIFFLAGRALLQGPSVPAFGVLFFLAGHALESSVFGLVLAYEHRNYMPMLGVLLALAWLTARMLQTWPRTLRVASIVVVLLCSWQLTWRVVTWSSADEFAEHLAAPRWNDSYGSAMELAHYYQEEGQDAQDRMLARLYTGKAVAEFEHATTLTQQPTSPLAQLLFLARSPEAADGYWSRLQEVAGSRPVTPEVLNAANTMAVCLLAEQCPLSRSQFAAYIDRLVANPRQNQVSTTLLKRAAGTFYIKIYGQPDKGLALSREAAASGMPEARESLIKNLGYLGRSAEARQEYVRFVSEVPVTAESRARIEAAIANPGVVMP